MTLLAACLLFVAGSGLARVTVKSWRRGRRALAGFLGAAALCLLVLGGVALFGILSLHP